ncbi:MAG: T9SS type A sorting domain-containing protein [Bacteroidia bacterium]|nr:T9SS type A sorting domain-containing protein [Bacteroidia bacterium]
MRGLILSTNNGSNWTAVNNGLTGYTLQVWSLAISDTNIFAGTWDGIFLSTVNGVSWTTVNNGLPVSTFPRSFAVYGTNIFAGTSDGSGVYLSTNNGGLWTAVNDGLPLYTQVESLAINSTDIFAGTWGRGVWKRPLSELVSVNEISQNNVIRVLPNPVKDNIIIQTNIKNKCKESLISIYDIQGQLLLQQPLLQEKTELDISKLA